ncbi:MAG: DUF305 domain-containing protein [Ilumatobacteraceae bacterium]
MWWQRRRHACGRYVRQCAVEFNDADVTFAQGMIPHHSQAIDMAALAADRTDNPAILDLATRIQGAQDPEIEMMQGWLQTWGHDEMATDMEGMDHDMSGMMTDDDMTALEAASGPSSIECSPR